MRKKTVINKLAIHVIQWQGYYVPIIIGIFMLIFFFSPIEIVPDFLGIEKLNDPLAPVSLIISTLGSILGVTFAFVFIVFETVRNRYGRIGVMRFLKNPIVIFHIVLQICIISYGFIFLLISGGELSSQDITCVYFFSFLFLVCMFTMLPVGKLLLHQSESYKIIEQECARISGQAIVDMVGYNHGVIEYKKEVESLDLSPFVILRDIGVKYSAEGNERIPAYIIQESTRTFLSLIPGNINRRALTEGYNSLFLIWNGIINDAVKNGHYLPLRQIWNSIKEIHEYYVKNRIDLIRTEAVVDFYKDFIDVLLKNDKDEILIEALYLLDGIFEKHLSCMPDENKLTTINYVFDLNREVHHNSDIEIQWEHVSRDIPNLLKDIARKAIEHKKARVLDTALFSYVDLVRVTLRAGLGRYQEQVIVVDLMYDSAYMTQECLKEKILDFYSSERIFDSSIMNEILEERPEYATNVIRPIIDHIRFLKKNDFLNLRFPYRGFLGGNLRHLLSLHKKGDKYGEIIEPLLKLIDWLREQFEQDVSKHYNNYLALYDIVSKLTEWHKKESKLIKNSFPVKKQEDISDELLMRISEILTSFEFIDEAKTFAKNSTFDW